MSYPYGLLLHCLYCRVGSYDGQDVINNLVMYAYLTQRASFTQPTLWWAILFLSPAQLIRYNSTNQYIMTRNCPGGCRKPTGLKNILRPLRVALGPVSTHLSLAAGFGQLMASSVSPLSPLSPLSQPEHSISASLVITYASLAGIVFRQGNS